MKNIISSHSSETPVSSSTIFGRMRAFAEQRAVRVAIGLGALGAVSSACSEDGTVYCADSSSELCPQTGSGSQDAGTSADTTDAGSSDSSSDTGSVSPQADATGTSDSAADTVADLTVADSATATADATDAQATQDTAADTTDTSSDLLDATPIAGFDAAGADAQDAAAEAQAETQPALPPPTKFWNSHPNAPKDEQITGCSNPELPQFQKVVPSGAYQIAKIEPGKSLEDMIPDLAQSNNGEQLYSVPSSQFPINADGKAYRIVGAQMQNEGAAIGTYVLSKNKKTGAVDRMPLFGVGSKVGMHAFEIAKAVQAALAPDKFDKLSDVHDAAMAKLDPKEFDVRPIVAGTPGKADGTKFSGKEKGKVWVIPSANAQCTEVQ